MRILILSTTYFPRRGGLETYVYNLAHGLKAKGHEVLVVTNRDDHTLPVWDTDGEVPIYRTSKFLNSMAGVHKVPWEEALFGVLEDLAEVIKGQGFDIIHALTQASLLIGGMIKHALGCPLVGTLVETLPGTDPVGESRSRFIMTCLPYDRILAGSDYYVRQALSYGAPKERVRRVYLGIDVDKFSVKEKPAARQALREAFNIPHGRDIICLVGRFKERKGHLNFLKAFELVMVRRPVHAILAGARNGSSRSYLEEIRRFICDKNLSNNVTVTEDVTDELCSLILRGSSLSTQPSRAEGLGLTVIEALASETPVIAADIDGIREIIIHKETGLLLDVLDAELYAATLDTFLNDRTELTRITRNGLSRVRTHFSCKKMVEDSLKEYGEIRQKTLNSR